MELLDGSTDESTDASIDVLDRIDKTIDEAIDGIIEEAKALRQKGLSYSEIARILRAKGVEVSRVTVMRWCKGLHDPRNRLNSVKLDPSPELAYVIGVMFGDGCVGFRRAGRAYRYRIRLKVVDKDFAEEFKRCLEALGLKPSLRLERDKTRCDRWCVEANSKILYEFLKRPKEKLFEVAKKYPIEFLRGFFDSEGTVYLNPKNPRIARVRASNYDLELLEFMKVLLLDLGIYSTIYITKKKGEQSNIRGKIYKYRKNFYIIDISRKDSVKKFAINVGFTIRRKQNKLETFLRFLQ